jgi:hypothetical protein
MCSGEYGTMGIRCYEHNNELIFYCLTDHKLICANCMYPVAQEVPPDPSQSSAKKPKERAKKNQFQGSSSVHTHHDVRQISKSIKEMSNDLGAWQYEFKEEVNKMVACRTEW